MPIILIGISITVFVMFTKPFMDDVGNLSTQLSSRNEALDTSKTLGEEKEKLVNKYNSISKDDLAKLQKLLPDNIDNIRLILEIEKIALPYGMVLKDVKYDATDPATGTSQGGKITKGTPTNYGVWDLSFSTTGTYGNFLNLLKDLEKNLRIVDISSIQFSSNTTSGLGSSLNPLSSDSYKYDFQIKTYWLKN